MPRLSDYLSQESAQQFSSSFPTDAAQPVSQRVLQPDRQWNAHNHIDAVGTSAEVAKLQQQHSGRVQERGPRLYRQADGSLAHSTPEKQPYAVANRHKWHGLVQHCRQLPGVNQQLERAGKSGRYHINVSYSQHASALAAAGLVAEHDASGHWLGHQPELDDPLADPAHGLRHDTWRNVTRAVLHRAAEVHGASTMKVNRWQAALYS